MNLKMLNGFGLPRISIRRVVPTRPRVSCITTPDAFTHRPHGNGAVSYVERRRHWLTALYALVTFQWQCEGCVLEDADFSASPLSPSCLSRHHRGDGTHSRVVAMLGRRGLSCDARGELVDGQEA